MGSTDGHATVLDVTPHPARASDLQVSIPGRPVCSTLAPHTLGEPEAHPAIPGSHATAQRQWDLLDDPRTDEEEAEVEANIHLGSLRAV